MRAVRIKCSGARNRYHFGSYKTVLHPYPEHGEFYLYGYGKLLLLPLSCQTEKRDLRGVHAERTGSDERDDQMKETGKRNSWKVYLPMFLAIVLACLAIVSGVLDRQKTWLGLCNSDIHFTEGAVRSTENGDHYGEMTAGPYFQLPPGTYRLRWFIDCDGENAIRLRSDNGAEKFICDSVHPGEFEGEAFFTIRDAADSFQIVTDFCGGTQIQIYDFILDSPVYHDHALTGLLASSGFLHSVVAV